MLRSIPSTSRASAKVVQTSLGSPSFLRSAGSPPLRPFVPASLLVRPSRSQTSSLLLHQKRRVTVVPPEAILEADPNPLPTFEPLVEPPLKPKPSRIVHYHTPSITSDLCRSLFTEVTNHHGSGSIFMSVTNPFPLEIDYSLVEGGRPTEEQWQEMRSFMREERREKSLQAVPPAVLVESAENDEKISGIPKTFHSPMVVNYTTRKVCRGPAMFSETEKMLAELRVAQHERLRLEALWDAHLYSQGIKAPKREEPKQNSMFWWEKAILLLAATFVLDRWVLGTELLGKSKKKEKKNMGRKERELDLGGGGGREREEARERRERELTKEPGFGGRRNWS
ncbi:hypothetical protein BDY24DRAFT_438240 [Mrakia frigida]|uniref:uncharacterized protein n=1 Tax=Mrakia frigida TaxID=29902 RepID=UPI003FCBFE23